MASTSISGITAKNENVLALAATNFNFSLVTLEAPKEFKELGAALSLNRRTAAENGSSHITARKLGALFEQALDANEELIKAYGRRASEISASPLANPRGSRSDGFFQNQVGADGTAIWAAATSGRSAIAANLLACLLARLWSGPEATAIWVELVEERKKEIAASCDGSEPSHLAPISAAREQISRKELAEWDASARSWLRAGDQVKKREQKQLGLILDNLDLPVDNTINTYRNVIQAWKTAMETIGKLITGMPHRVQNGAVLLALSAWHIYPDMVVLGDNEKKVNQRDPLVAPEGYITIGLQNHPSSPGDGVYWSLSLAHLRYYGLPIVCKRSAGSDAARVSFEQLLFSVLGTFFAGWQLDVDDWMQAAELVVSIWEFINEKVEETGYQASFIDKSRAQKFLTLPSNWMKILYQAARALLESEGADREEALLLVKAGARRLGSSFLATEGHPCPVFDLTKPSIFLQLLKGEEERIKFLRSIGGRSYVKGSNSVIRYFNTKSQTFEYATLFPDFDSTKRSHDGSTKHTTRHRRWIPHNLEGRTKFCKCRNICSANRSCKKRNLPCGSSCHKKTAINCGNSADEPFRKRINNQNKKDDASDEYCYHIDEAHVRVSEELQLFWYNMPTLSAQTEDTAMSDADNVPDNAIIPGNPLDTANSPQALDLDSMVLEESFIDWEKEIIEFDLWSDERTTTFNLALGDPEIAAIYVQEIKESQEGLADKTPLRIMVSDVIEAIKSDIIGVDLIVDHLVKYWSKDLKASQEYLNSVRKIALEADAGQLNALDPLIERGSKDPEAPQNYLRSLKAITSKAKNQLDHLIKNWDKDPVRATNQLRPLKAITSKAGDQLGHFVERWSSDLRAAQNYLRSLKAIASVAEIYKILPGATVALQVIRRTIHEAHWLPAQEDPENLSGEDLDVFRPFELNRAQTFACIAMFETGTLNIHPDTLSSVMAMATSDSIYVAAPLLCDPGENPRECEVRRVIGNIGRAGIAMLIPPQNPRVREFSIGNWRQINHIEFDGTPQDCFQSTSLHLSFTGYSQPVMSVISHGAQDIEAYFLESLISVQDRGQWVADLDVLSIFQKPHFYRFPQFLDCGHAVVAKPPFKAISIDHWDELLDKPEAAGIIRANGNWLARLASTAVSVQENNTTIVIAESPCWTCYMAYAAGQMRTEVFASSIFVF